MVKTVRDSHGDTPMPTKKPRTEYMTQKKREQRADPEKKANERKQANDRYAQNPEPQKAHSQTYRDKNNTPEFRTKEAERKRIARAKKAVTSQNEPPQSSEPSHE